MRYGAGGLKLPLKATDIDSTELSYAVADPALHALLALFEAALNAELTESWTVVCASPASLPADSILADSTTPVADKLHVSPTPDVLDVMRQRECGWPLLTLSRDGPEEAEEYGLHRQKWKQKWQLYWIAGPITATDWLKLAGVERLIAETVKRVCYLQSHPAHNDGADQLAADSVDDPPVLGTIRVIGSEMDWGGPDGKFAAVQVTLESTDLTTELTDAYAPFTSAQITEAVGQPALGIVPALIEGDTKHPGTMYKPGR